MWLLGWPVTFSLHYSQEGMSVLVTVGGAIALALAVGFAIPQAATVACSLLCGLLMFGFAASWVISTKMLRPPWLADPDNGHHSRSPTEGSEGLTRNVLGDARKVWRISPTVDGLGDPLSSLGLAYEAVEFPIVRRCMPGNVALRGWLVPPPLPSSGGGGGNGSAAGGDVCVVAVHGGGRDRRAFMRHVPAFHRAGCSVLLFDQEEHGMSDGSGRRLGWSTYERWDVLSAVAYARRRGFRTVIACGTSMGAAGCILAAADAAAPVPGSLPAAECPRIDAVIAENPFSTRRGLIVRLLVDGAVAIMGAQLAVVLTCLQPLVVALVGLRGGFAGHPDPLEAMPRLVGTPLLLMHGTADKLVQHECSQELFARLREAVAAVPPSGGRRQGAAAAMAADKAMAAGENGGGGSGGSSSCSDIGGSSRGHDCGDDAVSFREGVAPHWLWLCEGAGHAALHNVDPVEYEKLLRSLIAAARVHSAGREKVAAAAAAAAAALAAAVPEGLKEEVVVTHSSVAMGGMAGELEGPGASMEAT